MNPDDRETLSDVRYRLHGVVMSLGSIADQALFRELEGDIDALIAKITKKLKRPLNP